MRSLADELGELERTVAKQLASSLPDVREEDFVALLGEENKTPRAEGEGRSRAAQPSRRDRSAAEALMGREGFLEKTVVVVDDTPVDMWISRRV